MTESPRDSDGRAGPTVRRRRLLAALTAAGTGAIAGCRGDDAGDGAETGTGGQSGTPEQSEATEQTDSASATTATDRERPTAETTEATDGSARPDGYRTPRAPSFDDPDSTVDDVEIFRGVAFEETPDGVLELDFYRPAADGPHPLVVHLHGGAWKFGSRTSYAPWHAEQGVAAATVDYRLSGTAEYPAAARDVAAAVTWLRREAAGAAGVDPARVVVRGKSAGAHLAALVATAPDIDAVAPVGLEPELSGLAGLLGISGIYDLTTDRVPAASYASDFFGCAPSGCPATYEEASPTEQVTGDTPPTLLWHGNADELVDVEQSRLFRDALADAGVPVDLLAPDEAGHVEELYESWRERFRAAERAFLAETVDIPEGSATPE